MDFSREMMDIFEALAPELKENEDEKAHKRIEQLIRLNTSGAEKTHLLAYLEKQKPAESHHSNDNPEYDKGYMDGKAFQLKQTEQYSIGKTFMGLIPCWVNAPSTLQPAHKYHGKNAVIMHENNGGFRCCFIDDEKATTIHLPENTLFVEGWRKKPTKWSKDDEAILSRCISDIERAKHYALQKPELYDIEINWLKSLKPRWKPNEEQIKALYSAVNDAIALYSNKVSPVYEEISRTHFDALDSLYNDLKKLM